MRANRIMPVAARIDPVTATALYRPVLAIACPLMVLPKTAPIMSGVSRLPDRVGDTPSTPCMNSAR